MLQVAFIRENKIEVIERLSKRIDNYMYEDEDGGFWVDAHSAYYGELEYRVRYKNKEDSFLWMYLDFERLKTACTSVGLNCKKVMDGPHHDFLAQITLKD